LQLYYLESRTLEKALAMPPFEGLLYYRNSRRTRHNKILSGGLGLALILTAPVWLIAVALGWLVFNVAKEIWFFCIDFGTWFAETILKLEGKE
jgi:hypothetical protein